MFYTPLLLTHNKNMHGIEFGSIFGNKRIKSKVITLLASKIGSLGNSKLI